MTASLYKLYERKAGFIKVLLIGYIGAIGVATLSDCVFPFFGESILGVAIPAHADLHEHDEAPVHNHEQEQDTRHEHSSESETGGKIYSIRRQLHLSRIGIWSILPHCWGFSLHISDREPDSRTLDMF